MSRTRVKSIIPCILPYRYVDVKSIVLCILLYRYADVEIRCEMSDI